MATEHARSHAGFEGPVLKAEDDRYGYTAIAQGLARSISTLDENISTVIGIEGKWGSGKTSLLNLLTDHLKTQVPATTQIVVFSPWVNSPDVSPVTALLVHIAARLSRLESPLKKQKGRLSPLAEDLLNYARQTSRSLAPLTRFGSKFVPWMGIIADGMEAMAETELGRQEKTAAELRADIERQIVSLGVSFIVLIDDLDRLEPAQAVEVLRMVRSVADFSQFRYVMCYDRDVLAHAVETGLCVHNGKLYLQKIIPLSFSLPRLESFDLRREFREGALTIWREVNEAGPDDDEIGTLSYYSEVYGEALSTPREVSQALNAIRFRYPGLRDYIYYPDLCLMQLMAIVNPDLAIWVEHYLTEWSIVENRDGHVQDEEKKQLTEKLVTALAKFGVIRARSVWELHDWLPGISGFDDKTLSLFAKSGQEDKELASTQRRLSSPIYWRFYFSFSAPQNVMSDTDIQDILSLAASDYASLERRLLSSVTANGVSSRTWFEHILTRLTPHLTLSAGPRAQRNLLKFLLCCSDRIIPFYRERDIFFRQHDLGIDTLASQLITQLKKGQNATAMPWISRLFREAGAFAWATIYLSHLSRRGDGDPVSRAELAQLQLMMRVRLSDREISEKLAEIPCLMSFIYAWRDTACLEEVTRWLEGNHMDDRTFLRMLLNLRTAVSSSDAGAYLRLDLQGLQKIFGVEGIESRLERIKEKEETALLGMLTDVETAIRLNNV